VANKGWSILFGVVMAACGLSFAVAPFRGWMMPVGASSHAADVDFLYWVIFWIVAFFFILTEAILVAFLWLYSSTPEGKRPVSETAETAGVLKPLTGFLHNQHRVELAWTFVPAVILLYIAFAQVTTWANIKYEVRKNESKAKGQGESLQIAVSARQFEWRMRYPSVERFQKWMNAKDAKAQEEIKADFASFGKMPQADDVYTVNELHIWQDHQVVVWLTTRDVIHSFNLPNFRVKQDALPGKMIPVWFRTIDSKPDPNDSGKPHHKTHNCRWNSEKQRYVDGYNPETQKDDDNAYRYDIACAELCGWGHYRMIGRVYVHENQAKFLEWLIRAEEYNRQRDGDWVAKADARIKLAEKQ
jgi:cytochrome c oxidase subunit II